MRYSKILSAALLSFVMIAPAYAEKPAHAGKKYQGHEKVEMRKNDRVMVRFGGDERSVIRSYLKDSYGRKCPPGLAKKNNGCLPPGQAKKYSVGGFLPAGYRGLPSGLKNRLGRAPKGSFYAMVDQDVLLVSESSKMILDAVTLMSAVR